MYDNNKYVNSEKLGCAVETITENKCNLYVDICESHNTFIKRVDHHSEQPYEEIILDKAGTGLDRNSSINFKKIKTKIYLVVLFFAVLAASVSSFVWIYITRIENASEVTQDSKYIISTSEFIEFNHNIIRKENTSDLITDSKYIASTPRFRDLNPIIQQIREQVHKLDGAASDYKNTASYDQDDHTYRTKTLNDWEVWKPMFNPLDKLNDWFGRK